MQVTVINLERSTERLREFHEFNKHLTSLARFPAIDGRRQDLAGLIRDGILQEPMVHRFTAGALGNALSHLSLWDSAISSGQTLTVCEDDAIFSGQFERQAPEIIGRLPGDWDIVLWGWNFDAPMVLDLGATTCEVFGDEAGLIRNIDEFQRATHPAQPMRLLLAFGILGYSVSAKGARALRDFCLPLRAMELTLPWPEPGQKVALKPKGMVVNSSLDVTMAIAYPTLRAFVSFPPLAIAKNEKHNSTIVRDVPLRDLLTDRGGGGKPASD